MIQNVNWIIKRATGKCRNNSDKMQGTYDKSIRQHINEHKNQTHLDERLQFHNYKVKICQSAFFESLASVQFPFGKFNGNSKAIAKIEPRKRTFT